MESVAIGNESPPARQSILGSFLRGRPRGVSQSHPSPPGGPHDGPQHSRDSPPPPPPPPTSSSAQDVPGSSGHRRRPAGVQPSLSQSLQPSSSLAGSGPFSQMLRRRRSASALASNATPQVPVARTATANASGNTNTTNNNNISNAPGSTHPAHRIRLVPHLDSRRSLRFDPICRDVREGDTPLRIGRFTDRSGLGIAAANALGSNKLAFKSKVVSRAHAEIWAEGGGRFYIKDTKSSSGTFLNHVRLSPANTESRAHELRDGDLLQLGVDYQGGTEDIYKCVKIRIEVGREWQAHTNPFNSNALKQLKSIAIPLAPTTGGKKAPASSKSALPDCCICLFSVTIRQALFIAPCSHAFHYKCIRPLLDAHHPAFNCPLCRTYANLDEDVEVELELEEEDEGEGESIADVIAAVGAATTPGGVDTSRERGERDAGAETEVEIDGGGGTPRIAPSFRRRSTANTNNNANQTANEVIDVDEEMEVEDGNPLPALPEDEDIDEDADIDADALVDIVGTGEDRDMSASPVSVAMPPAGHPSGSAEYLFEAEADGSGSGSGEADGSGSGGEAVGGGKRKR